MDKMAIVETIKNLSSGDKMIFMEQFRKLCPYINIEYDTFDTTISSQYSTSYLQALLTTTIKQSKDKQQQNDIDALINTLRKLSFTEKGKFPRLYNKMYPSCKITFHNLLYTDSKYQISTYTTHLNCITEIQFNQLKSALKQLEEERKQEQLQIEEKQKKKILTLVDTIDDLSRSDQEMIKCFYQALYPRDTLDLLYGKVPSGPSSDLSIEIDKLESVLERLEDHKKQQGTKQKQLEEQKKLKDEQKQLEEEQKQLEEIQIKQKQLEEHRRQQAEENKSEIQNDTINVGDLLENLKVIGNIKENDKIAIYENKMYIDQRYYFQGIRRMLYKDSRDETIKFINKILNLAKCYHDQLVTLVNYTETDNYKSLINNLTECKTGLSNLKITYANDEDIKRKINGYIGYLDI